MCTLGEHLAAYASAPGAPSPKLTRTRVFCRLESSEGVDLAEGHRDLSDQVLTIWIGLAVLDVLLSDKDVDPQPRDEVNPYFIRAAHVIPGDLHPIRPMMRLSSSPDEKLPRRLWPTREVSVSGV